MWSKQHNWSDTVMVLLWVPVHGKSKMRWSHFSVQLASWASVAVCAAVVCLWRCPAAKRSRSVPSPYLRHFWARRNVAAWTPRRRISYGDCFLFSLCSSGGNSSLVRRVISPKGGPTKHRTDRTDRTDRTGGEIAAGKAQINCRDLVINLYTAYHPIHD